MNDKNKLESIRLKPMSFKNDEYKKKGIYCLKCSKERGIKAPVYHLPPECQNGD